MAPGVSTIPPLYRGRAGQQAKVFWDLGDCGLRGCAELPEVRQQHLQMLHRVFCEPLDILDADFHLCVKAADTSKLHQKELSQELKEYAHSAAAKDILILVAGDADYLLALHAAAARGVQVLHLAHTRGAHATALPTYAHAPCIAWQCDWTQFLDAHLSPGGSAAPDSPGGAGAHGRKAAKRSCKARGEGQCTSHTERPAHSGSSTAGPSSAFFASFAPGPLLPHQQPGLQAAAVAAGSSSMSWDGARSTNPLLSSPAASSPDLWSPLGSQAQAAGLTQALLAVTLSDPVPTPPAPPPPPRPPHHVAELRQGAGRSRKGRQEAFDPPARRTEFNLKQLCKYLQAGSCPYGPACKFSHNRVPLPCKYYQEGHCKWGEHCLMMHTGPVRPASSAVALDPDTPLPRKMCKHFASAMGCTRDDCGFCHERVQAPCPHYHGKGGRCSLGSLCSHQHGSKSSSKAGRLQDAE